MMPGFTATLYNWKVMVSARSLRRFMNSLARGFFICVIDDVMVVLGNR